MGVEREERRGHGDSKRRDPRRSQLVGEWPAAKRHGYVVNQRRRTDVEEAIRRRHDRGEETREDHTRQDRVRVGMQELGRRSVRVRQLGVYSIEHERAHGHAYADPQQRGQHEASHRHRQHAPRVGDLLVHHELRHDVRLTGTAQREHEVPGQAPEHAQRSPGPHRLRVVTHDDLDRTRGTAVDGIERGQEDEQRGDHHHAALHHIGIHRCDDPARHAVKDEDGAGDHDAGDQADAADDLRPFEDILQHRCHRQYLRCEIPHDAEQDRDRGQQTRGLAPVARPDGVR